MVTVEFALPDTLVRYLVANAHIPGHPWDVRPGRVPHNDDYRDLRMAVARWYRTSKHVPLGRNGMRVGRANCADVEVILDFLSGVAQRMTGPDAPPARCFYGRKLERSLVSALRRLRGQPGVDVAESRRTFGWSTYSVTVR